MKKNFGKGRGSKQKPEREGQGSGPKTGKSRRDIKNARGLRDVLGVGDSGGRRNAPAPSRPPERPIRGGGPSTQRDNRPTPASSPSSKLTHIMTFRPPPGAEAEVVSTRPSRPQTKPAHSSAEIGNQPNRPAAKPATHENMHTRSDYRWPKDRMKTPESDSRSARGTAKQAGTSTNVTGIVKRHPDGFGFLLPDDPSHPDVYISRQSMTGIMTNDRVEVRVYKPKSAGKSREDRLAGEIVRVVKRGHTRVVGKYLPVDQKYGVILDEGRGWGADLRIAAKDSLGAAEGELVAVEILQYPDDNQEFIGKVTGLIGDSDDPVNDVIRIVHQSGIPSEFSATAHGEAKRFGGVVTEAEKKGREDLTQLPIITIDGATARDFDDAIYVEQTEKGFHLIVAIADVSHYVKPGSKLDQEAYERGTSTYFPNYVVPMLPEELSNELCSLKPNVERLCFACEMRLSFTGEIQSYRFFEGVMLSHARVTYGEAQEVIDGATPPKLKDVAENIKLASDLAKILMQKRFREGSLDLEIPETQVVVDPSGETVDIIRSERLFAHRLIEELMLVTNICTARFLDGAGIPGVYRVHEEPEEENIRALQRYLWNLGGHRSVVGSNLQKKLTKALQSMEGRPEAGILNILTLRTMKQAHYSQDNVGHFGLGFTHYTHFTSPIRRYPDLIAHRLIKSQIYPRYKSMQMTEEELSTATTMLSACEQRSTKAERQVISIKKARFIKKFVGHEFEGIISSVTKFGVFVLLRQYDVDGLVKLEQLGDDRFVFDEDNLRLIGQRRGLRYSIGDSIQVLVAGVDTNLGKVDFELAQAAEGHEPDEDDDLDFVNDWEPPPPKGQRDHGAKPVSREEGRQHRRGGKSAKGRANEPHQNKPAKGKGLDAAKRGSAEDHRRGVRKERFSKRRGKN